MIKLSPSSLSTLKDCTLNAARVLLNLKPGLLKEIEKSKGHRIDMQYYTDRAVSDRDYAEDVKSAPAFVMEMEKIASNMTGSDIQRIRNLLRKTAENPSKASART